MSCKLCIMFVTTNDSIGNCHLLPPTKDGFPRVNDYDFCGSFSPEKTPVAPKRKKTQS